MPTPTTDQTKTAEAEAKAKLEANKTIAPESTAAKFIQNLISPLPTKKADDKPKAPYKPYEDDARLTGEDDQPPAKPAPKKKVATPAPSPVIDEEKLGQSIGKSIAEHTARATKAEQQVEELKLDPKDARRIAVLERMESLNGERYVGLPKRYSENKTKLRDYAAEWEKANPGETFDENADEHADFIEALEAQVAYDDEDYIDAQSAIRAEQIVEAQKSEIDKRISKIEQAERKRMEKPKIDTAAAVAGNEYWKDMGEEFAAVVDSSGAIDGEALKAIQEADPIKYDIVTGAAQTAEGMAATIYALANGIETYDPKNEAHAGVTNFAITQETQMMQRPVEDRRDEQGRLFVRKAEYDRMTKAEREQHWIYSPDELTFMAVHTISKQAKAYLKAEDEKFRKRAKARGLILDDENSIATPERRVATSRKDDDDSDDSITSGGVRKPLSPSVFTSPKLAASKSGAGAESKTGMEGFIKKLIG